MPGTVNQKMEVDAIIQRVSQSAIHPADRDRIKPLPARRGGTDGDEEEELMEAVIELGIAFMCVSFNNAMIHRTRDGSSCVGWLGLAGRRAAVGWLTEYSRESSPSL